MFVANFKIEHMKKLLFTLLTVALIISCSGPAEAELGELVTKETKDGNLYYLTIEGENGDKSKEKVEFSIDRVIVDSLKLKPGKIKSMCEDAVIYADWDVKFKPTYKHSTIASLSFDAEENRIVAYMSGTAENAYGTPDNISSSIPFTVKGVMKKDSDGLPEIFTF